MSATGETIAAIQSLISHLEQATAAACSAANQADQARAMAAALGATRNIVELTSVYELIGQVDSMVVQALQRAHEAIGQARTVEGG